MKILLADDHILFRDALIQFIHALRSDWKIEVAGNYDDALKIIATTNDFDLIMLDFLMPGMHKLEGLTDLCERYPDQVVAIISGVAEEEDIKKALEYGARAYFPKTLSGKVLVKAIEYIMETGEKFVPVTKDGKHIMPSHFDDHKSDEEDGNPEGIQNKLTRRENEVLLLLAQGLSNKEIAEELDIQIATVKLHVGGICKKLEVDNRTQAAILAHQHGLLKKDG